MSVMENLTPEGAEALKRLFVARHSTIPVHEVYGLSPRDLERWAEAICGFPEISDESTERVEIEEVEANIAEIEASLRRRARAIVASIAGGNADAWNDLEVNQDRIKAINRIEY